MDKRSGSIWNLDLRDTHKRSIEFKVRNKRIEGVVTQMIGHQSVKHPTHLTEKQVKIEFGCNYRPSIPFSEFKYARKRQILDGKVSDIIVEEIENGKDPKRPKLVPIKLLTLRLVDVSS